MPSKLQVGGNGRGAAQVARWLRGAGARLAAGFEALLSLGKGPEPALSTQAGRGGPLLRAAACPPALPVLTCSCPNARVTRLPSRHRPFLPPLPPPSQGRNAAFSGRLERQPMFCFETAVKMFHWSCLAYIFKEVRSRDMVSGRCTTTLNRSCCSALHPPTRLLCCFSSLFCRVSTVCRTASRPALPLLSRGTCWSSWKRARPCTPWTATGWVHGTTPHGPARALLRCQPSRLLAHAPEQLQPDGAGRAGDSTIDLSAYS